MLPTSCNLGDYVMNLNTELLSSVAKIVLIAEAVQLCNKYAVTLSLVN